MPVFLEMSGMILSILSRFCLSLVNLGQWRKKWLNVSISKSQVQIGLSVSKKLSLNLCCLKRLRPIVALDNKTIKISLIVVQVFQDNTFYKYNTRIVNFFPFSFLRKRMERVINRNGNFGGRNNSLSWKWNDDATWLFVPRKHPNILKISKMCKCINNSFSNEILSDIQNESANLEVKNQPTKTTHWQY